MLNRIAKVVAVMMLLVAANSFAEEGEVVRVLVGDKGMKPAAAAITPKYEYVTAKLPDGKVNPAVLCGECCKKADNAATKPAFQGKSVAFMCASCKTVCWHDDGRQMKFTDEADVKAMKAIEEGLKQPVDKTQKPTIQALQKRS
jgi:hypothetical protein